MKGDKQVIQYLNKVLGNELRHQSVFFALTHVQRLGHRQSFPLTEYEESLTK